ncbi:hypothetical protein [Streptomyces bambusae]|uniref:ABC transporter permease n=1 Tax=Streptomyces bambusae TaxID=1550616 RepID=A0ABS6Z2K6_9ACTN|nr:hypothetical protein [Streptomyces bambusae]MBW5481973.1 hypothetical protein [Streptomyces bambusae]
MSTQTTDPMQPGPGPFPAGTAADTPGGPPHTPHPARALRRAAAYEWHHLRGLRATWVLLSVAAVLTVGNGVSLLLVADTDSAPTPATVADALQWAPAATQLPLLALLLIALGTSSVSTDLTRGAARTTWLTAASRTTAFVAKLCVAALLTSATAVVTVLIAGAAGASALAMSGTPQPAWEQTLPALLRFTLVMACWPVLAGSVAALLRNRVWTVLLLVLWPLIIERLTGLLLGRLLGISALHEVLPFAAARAAMADASDTSTDASPAQGLLDNGLGPWTGLMVHVLFALAVAVAGAWAYRRRDGA